MTRRKKIIESTVCESSVVSRREPTPSGELVPDKRVTTKQEAFCRFYVEHGNASEAYRFAYDVGDDTRVSTVRISAWRLLAIPKVAARVRELRALIAAPTLASTAELIADLEAMATADVNELMHVTVVNCRHCWGYSGYYQWRDEAELAEAAELALASRDTPKPEKMPDYRGGFDFRPDRDPNPRCVKCDGVGHNVVRLANTADVTHGARKLYRGIELYPDGTVKKVLLNDPLAARIELHRVRGMHVNQSINLNANVSVQPLKSMSHDDALNFLESLRPTK